MDENSNNENSVEREEQRVNLPQTKALPQTLIETSEEKKISKKLRFYSFWKIAAVIAFLALLTLSSLFVFYIKEGKFQSIDNSSCAPVMNCPAIPEMKCPAIPNFSCSPQINCSIITQKYYFNSSNWTD